MTDKVTTTDVLWNGDGTYSPRCNICDWTGKARVTRAGAHDALKSHRRTQRHQATWARVTTRLEGFDSRGIRD